MGRVRRNVNGFPRAHNGLLAAEVGFDLAFEDCERFLKVMPMRAWPSARRNQHIDKSIGFWLLVAGLISSGHSCFTCQSRPRVSPISSKAAATSAVRFLKAPRLHFPSRLRARQTPG